MSKTTVRRIRWFDPDPDDLQSPENWRHASWILATLFLNVFFWTAFETAFWVLYPLPIYAVVVVIAALIVAGLFFLGPALAAQRAEQTIFQIVDRSVGTLPGFVLRCAGIGYLALWLAFLLDLPVLWWGARFASRATANWEIGLAVGVILSFAFFTSAQSLPTRGQLAKFTCFVAIAILIAALIRVRDGWPAALRVTFSSGDARYSLAAQGWHGLSTITFGVAPVAFLGASYGRRVTTRQDVLRLTFTGIVLPLGGVLSILGVISVVTSHSVIYQPSLFAGVNMALFGRASRNAVLGRMVILAFPVIGAVRFGMNLLRETVPGGSKVGRASLLVISSWIVALIPVYKGPVGGGDSARVFEIFASVFVVTAAVVSADYLVKSRTGLVKRIDWIGTGGALLGLVVPFGLNWWRIAQDESWWWPWLLPSYAISFTVCLLCRAVEDGIRRRRSTVPGRSENDGVQAGLGQA